MFYGASWLFPFLVMLTKGQKFLIRGILVKVGFGALFQLCSDNEMVYSKGRRAEQTSAPFAVIAAWGCVVSSTAPSSCAVCDIRVGVAAATPVLCWNSTDPAEKASPVQCYGGCESEDGTSTLDIRGQGKL